MQQIKLNEPETLPTDGTIVLLFLHDGTVCNAFFSNFSPTNDAKDDGEYDWVCCEDRAQIHGESSRIYARLASAVRAGAGDIVLGQLLRAEVQGRGPNA